MKLGGFRKTSEVWCGEDLLKLGVASGVDRVKEVLTKCRTSRSRSLIDSSGKNETCNN